MWTLLGPSDEGGYSDHLNRTYKTKGIHGDNERVLVLNEILSLESVRESLRNHIIWGFKEGQEIKASIRTQKWVFSPSFTLVNYKSEYSVFSKSKPYSMLGAIEVATDYYENLGVYSFYFIRPLKLVPQRFKYTAVYPLSKYVSFFEEYIPQGARSKYFKFNEIQHHPLPFDSVVVSNHCKQEERNKFKPYGDYFF